MGLIFFDRHAIKINVDNIIIFDYFCTVKKCFFLKDKKQETRNKKQETRNKN